MSEKIDYDFGSVCLEWHMYRNQDMTLDELQQEIETAWNEAELLEMEHEQTIAREIGADDVQSSILADELPECHESPLSDIVGNFEDAHQHMYWMLEEFDGTMKCGTFVFGKNITTNEKKAKMASAG